MKHAAEDEAMLRTRKLPVLLFIHGDNLFWGSGNYVDASLISFTTNIIVITMNYRLGVFGKLFSSRSFARFACHFLCV